VKNLPARRPAETTAGVAAALAVLICALLDVDDPTIYGALVIVVGFIPTAVTSLVVYVQSARREPQGTTLAPKTEAEVEVIEPPPPPLSKPSARPPTKRRKRGT
jgi:hypothetical protein